MGKWTSSDRIWQGPRSMDRSRPPSTLLQGRGCDALGLIFSTHKRADQLDCSCPRLRKNERERKQTEREEGKVIAKRLGRTKATVEAGVLQGNLKCDEKDDKRREKKKESNERTGRIESMQKMRARGKTTSEKCGRRPQQQSANMMHREVWT